MKPDSAQTGVAHTAHASGEPRGSEEAVKYPYVSLFSGAMGLDLGLEQAGFRPAVLNENDPAAVRTVKRNRPKYPVVDRDITTVSTEDLEVAASRSLKNIPLIAGGPPCQAFSVMGRRRGLMDERGGLVYEFVEKIAELQPNTFLMENVRGLLSMALLPKTVEAPAGDEWKKVAGTLYESMVRRFEELGYRVDCFVVNSANYGAPQVRERVIVVGNRFNLEANFPSPRFSNRPEDSLPPFRTLRDAIGNGYVDADPTLMNFSPRKLRYLALVPPGGNWRSLPEDLQREAMGKQYYLKGGRSSSWRRLSWDFPSPTVHTLPNHATTSMCHPGELRALTVGECSAIQEFPRDFHFEGTPSERYRQIGNAVPIRLGKVAGDVVRDLLARIESLRSEDSVPIPSRVVHLRPHVRVRSWYKGGEALAGNFGYGGIVSDEQLHLEPTDR